MLRNISYNNPKIKNEILKMIGDKYTLFERIKMNGIGSSSLKITASSSEIQNLLDLDNNDNCCNIEIRKNGLIIRFRSLLETYGLIIPFYKLKLFKGESNVYSIYIDKYFIKVLVDKKKDHQYFKKILNIKNSN